MKLFLSFVTSLLFFCAASALAAGNWEMLPIDQLELMKKRPCTFFHVWANWCPICMDELPELVQVLGQSKKINPVVIDISSTYVQDTFSKAFLATIHLPFVTYLKPAGDDSDYMDRLAGSWSKQLPFSAVFHKGKRKKIWIGSFDNLDTVNKRIEALCR